MTERQAQWQIRCKNTYGRHLELDERRMRARQAACEQYAISATAHGYTLNLIGSLRAMVRYLSDIFPKADTELQKNLVRVMLHEIGVGMETLDKPLPLPVFLELDQFLLASGAFAHSLSGSRMQKAVRQGRRLFADTAALNETDCGSFWRQLIESIPVREDPEELYRIFGELGCIYAYFCSGGEDAAALRADALAEAYCCHQFRRAILHPDAEQAAAQLLEDDPGQWERSFAQLLIAAYPHLTEKYAPELLAELNWKTELALTFYTNPILAVSMWRTLLDASEPALGRSEALCALLMEDFIGAKLSRPGLLEPFLDALRDARFRRQIYGSACMGELQLHFLMGCKAMNHFGRARKSLAVAAANPYPREKWSVTMEQLEAAIR